MGEERNRDTTEISGGQTKSPAIGGGTEKSASDDTSAQVEYETLSAEVSEVEFETLLEDPAYFDFLESYGELAMPSDDEDLTVDDLIERNPALVETREESSNAASTKRSESPRSKFVTGLTDALESDDISAEERTALREALGLQSQKRTEVQLNYLKTRFLDLEAYLQAMEDFFDRNQTPYDELERQRTELATLSADQTALSERFDLARQRFEDVAGRQERYGERLENHDGRLDRHDERLDRHDEGLERHGEQLEGHGEQLERHDEQIESLERSLEQLKRALRRNLAVIEAELQSSKRWRRQVSEALQSTDTGTRDSDEVKPSDESE